MATSLSASVIAQAIVFQILDQLTVPGFLVHCTEVCAVYQKRSQLFSSLLHKHLPTLKFNEPDGGMFVWVDTGVPDSRELVMTAVKNGVLIVPGAEFYANDRVTGMVRMAFSYAKEDDMDEALRRLSLII